jgi:2Fe-2S ferredoxin
MKPFIAEPPIMIHLTFFEADGTCHMVLGAPGQTVMSTAVDNGLPGILADCGGACNCATCHVHIPEDWWAQVGGPNPAEDELLSVREDRDERSRLACQILLHEELDGLVLHLPESQY